MTLILAGDVMLGRGVAQALDGDWEAAFADVRPWLGAAQALAFANLESPLTTLPQVREGYDLRALPQAVAALQAAGFDAVSLANNHALDAGEAGLRETARTLRKAGIIPWLEGASTPMEETQPILGLAFDDSTVPLDLAAASADVAEAATQGPVVVVSIHWGGEYQAAPSVRQQAVARALAEAGATLIAGHGPHVPQRIEWIDDTLVAYSLGNFLFDQRHPLDCRWGVILRVTLQDAQIVGVEAIPTVTKDERVRRADQATTSAILERLGLEMDQEVE
ncbi:MAG: CapA family protein [Anaerolineae bacterium]|nr:CapA family protein [Anaerolineae bacterium]